MFEWIAQPEAWMALATLTALEVVLGIDNIIFLAILVQRLPPEQQKSARFFGLTLALGLRLVLLTSLAWLVKLTADLFTVLGQGVSGRDLVLILGGLFLWSKPPWKSAMRWMYGMRRMSWKCQVRRGVAITC